MNNNLICRLDYSVYTEAGTLPSNSTLEIAEIYIDGCDKPGFYTRASVHDYLQENPNTIKVNIGPYYPYLIPATSVRGVKYVRSEANDTHMIICLNCLGYISKSQHE